MILTPKETEDFENKIRQLSDFANSIGLKITNNGTQKNKGLKRETSPEEIKISGVRNLSENGLIDNVYECKITYIQN